MYGAGQYITLWLPSVLWSSCEYNIKIIGDERAEARDIDGAGYVGT